MARLLPPGDCAAWRDRFLPRLALGEPAALFTPARVADRSDGKIVHLDGLTLSRAWCWRALAAGFAPGDPRRALAEDAAARQFARWAAQAESYRTAERIEVAQSHEYAATIMNAVVTGEPAVIYGNVANRGFIPQLSEGAAVEVPCLVDANGIQPTVVTGIPPQLVALMRTNLNVQELTVAALMEEDRDHVYHAAMLDPHTAAELDLRQIRALVDDLIAAHDEWLPDWLRARKAA